MSNKYNAKKTKVDGFTFDSLKEAERYLVLKCLLKAGKIRDLEVHKTFHLIPKQTDEHGKVLERKCDYIADFAYVKDGQIIVEDVKSPITRAKPEYVLKRKMMLFFHGIRIKEVTDGDWAKNQTDKKNKRVKASRPRRNA